MTKEELFRNFKRNGHKKNRAVELLMGFLDIERPKAKKIFEEEYLQWLEAKKAEENKNENHIVETPKRRRLERGSPKGVGNDWEEAYQYTDR